VVASAPSGTPSGTVGTCTVQNTNVFIREIA